MTDTTPTDAEAALALLHEGEEPYEHEYTEATPAQWIWLWNRATPARRLEVAADVREACSRSDACRFAGHEERLAQVGAALGANIRALAVVDDWTQHRCMRPETRRALDEVRRALTGEEQPATGGIITGGLTVVGEGGSNCGTIPLLPQRSEWRGEHGPELVNLPRREPGEAWSAVELRWPGGTDDDRTTPDNPPTSEDTPDNQPHAED